MTITVDIKGEVYGLTFGMIAVEEMQIRSLHNLQSGLTNIGNIKALTDMFFCSHNNFADNSNGSTNRITYSKAAELIEELVYSNDIDVQNLIVSTFQNCRATKELMTKFETSGKKKAIKSRITTK